MEETGGAAGWFRIRPAGYLDFVVNAYPYVKFDFNSLQPMPAAYVRGFLLKLIWHGNQNRRDHPRQKSCRRQTAMDNERHSLPPPCRFVERGQGRFTRVKADRRDLQQQTRHGVGDRRHRRT